jgi:hypothetical protein
VGVAIGAAVLGVGWLGALFTRPKRNHIYAAIPWFALLWIVVAAWNACALLPTLNGAIADVAFAGGALVSATALLVTQGAWRRATLLGLVTIADAFASTALTLSAFGTGVFAVALVSQLPNASTLLSVLTEDIQNLIPNITAGLVAILLTIQLHDPVAPMVAIACVATQGRAIVIVIACITYAILTSYALLVRIAPCK